MLTIYRLAFYRSSRDIRSMKIGGVPRIDICVWCARIIAATTQHHRKFVEEYWQAALCITVIHSV